MIDGKRQERAAGLELFEHSISADVKGPKTDLTSCEAITYAENPKPEVLSGVDVSNTIYHTSRENESFPIVFQRSFQIAFRFFCNKKSIR